MILKSYKKQLMGQLEGKLLKRSANYWKISNKYPFSSEEKLYFCATLIKYVQTFCFDSYYIEKIDGDL